MDMEAWFISRNPTFSRSSQQYSRGRPFCKDGGAIGVLVEDYGLELESLKSVVTVDSFKEPSQREDAKKAVKKLFEERYNSGKNKWFFTKLRF
ncbi:hypothetical protein BGZ73_000237 [Actinomortierella ambigua]|nr:hypothetical protein BGZ73_000237 [Actinomortierella ambigua]